LYGIDALEFQQTCDDGRWLRGPLAAFSGRCWVRVGGREWEAQNVAKPLI
jgi:hypothetical protein